MANLKSLERLTPGMQLLVGGDQVLEVGEDLAAKFRPGDTLSVVPTTSEVLHIPAAERAVAAAAVGSAHDAFRAMAAVSEDQISAFYTGFARRLEDDAIWKNVQTVNEADVKDAQGRGRSTTRLVADAKLRANVIEGLLGWSRAESRRGAVLQRVEHAGWTAELVGAELGVVGFVFEGRPNVVADATGVLRGGNTVVFRIGRDALGTARAIMDLALRPALSDAGLPQGAVSLVDSASHAAGWALFSDSRLSLAVARGSGAAVDTLGCLARAAGIPVSLHGTGGAWVVLSASCSDARAKQVIADSLDRKVCNTLNTLCVLKAEASRLMPSILAGLHLAGERRGQPFKLHVASGSESFVDPEVFSTRVLVQRATGKVEEPQAELIAADQLGREWEWEDTPEITLQVVDSIDEAVELFNRYSPQFVATLVSLDKDEHERFYRSVNAPFVGDGFTRWVDGQYALKQPELGLSNWQHGRLFARGGVLSGDGVYTVRTRARGH